MSIDQLQAVLRILSFEKKIYQPDGEAAVCIYYELICDFFVCMINEEPNRLTEHNIRQKKIDKDALRVLH